MQLKHAPDYTKVKVNAPSYKGSGGIEPSEDRAKKQDQATKVYAKVKKCSVDCDRLVKCPPLHTWLPF